jgi:hypothetical protein
LLFAGKKCEKQEIRVKNSPKNTGSVKKLFGLWHETAGKEKLVI